ncbi:MAG: leucine-rich repeat protein [Clostridia bacterium]|nr:leucine-rich repeat protein [Clostridia bacterium]
MNRKSGLLKKMLVMVTVIFALMLLWAFCAQAESATSGTSSNGEYTWSVSEDGTILTFSPVRDSFGVCENSGRIKGNGGYPQYSTVTTIIIEEGITALPDNMFSNYIDIEKVVLPSTLKTIGGYDDTFNSPGYSIGCFRGCAKLKEINFPDGLQTIADNAFENCFALKEVILPDSVLFVGKKAFYLCSSIEKVRLSDALHTISEEAFYHCYALSEINMPEKLVNVGKRAFYECTSIAAIDFSAKLESIGEDAFYGCTALERVTLQHNLFGPATIGDNAFYGCENLKSIAFPDSVSSIGKYAFYGCSSLENVTLSANIETISDHAFEKCSSLKTVSYDTYNLIMLTSVGKYAFHECTSLKSVSLPRSLITIDEYAFAYTGLGTVVIPDKTETIGYKAFYNCTTPYITVGKGVKSIGEYAFYTNSKLNLYIYSPDCVFADNEYTVYSKNGVVINAAEASTSQAYAEKFNKEFSVISTTGNKTVAEGTDGGSITWKVTTDGITDTLTISGEGAIADYQSGNAPWSIVDSSISKLVIGEGVTRVGQAAFWGFKKLSTVTLPSTLESIGTAAFYECVSLKNITFPQALKTIESAAFLGCKSLTSISLPSSLTELGVQAFQDCKSLNTVFLSTSMTSIPESAFMRCESLRSISIYPNIESIGKNAFYYCTMLQPQFEEGVKTIGDAAFGYCTAITELILPQSLESIGMSAFANCTSLDSVTIYSRQCEIYDAENTFCNAGSISAYEGSTAQSYAEKYSRSFTALSETVVRTAVIYGEVYYEGEPVTDAYVSLGSVGGTSTGKGGSFSIFDCPYGEYMLRASYNGCVESVHVIVNYEEIYVGPIYLDAISTEVDLGKEVVAVSGIDALSDKSDNDFLAVEGNSITYMVNAFTSKGSDLIDSAIKADYSEYESIFCVDINIEKQKYSGKECEIEAITEANGILGVVFALPEEYAKASDFVVLREHNGSVDVLGTKPNADGEYFEVNNGYITVYANKFSVYSVVALTEVGEDKPSNSISIENTSIDGGSLSYTVAFESDVKGAFAVTAVYQKNKLVGVATGENALSGSFKLGSGNYVFKTMLWADSVTPLCAGKACEIIIK